MNECTGQLSNTKKPKGAQNTGEVHDAKIGWMQNNFPFNQVTVEVSLLHQWKYNKVQTTQNKLCQETSESACTLLKTVPGEKPLYVPLPVKYVKC